jgi:nucleoside-diphosphate-sugar epimerase
MRVLITGSGLVGSYTARALLDRGHDVLLFDRRPERRYTEAVVGHPVRLVRGDVCDVSALSAALGAFRPKAVIHTAAALEGSFQQDRLTGYTTNVLGGLCVAEAASRCRVGRLILCSSLAVYDFSRPAAALTEGHALGPETLYDHSKALAESALAPYCREAGVGLVVLRLAGIYGCGLFRGGAWMGPLLHRLILAARAGRTVVLDRGELGGNDCLYVKDAAQALAAACTATRAPGEVMNVGSGRLTGAEEIGAALEKAFPGAKSILTGLPGGPARPAHQSRAPLAIARARRLLGYRPAFPDLGAGLGDYARELDRLGDVVG